MRYIQIIFSISILFAACTSPEPQKEFTGDRQFRTTDPSRLYFNNIRSTSYYRSKYKPANADLYRNRKLSFNNKRPIIHPVIVNNWMSDEAYIFIEKNEYLEGWSDTLTVRWSQNDSIGGEYLLPIPSRPEMYAFAGKLYAAMKEGKDLETKNAKGEFVPLLKNQEDRTAFQVTMRDYYRLTELF
jgi:hypothetical protein